MNEWIIQFSIIIQLSNKIPIDKRLSRVKAVSLHEEAHTKFHEASFRANYKPLRAIIDILLCIYDSRFKITTLLKQKLHTTVKSYHKK